MSLDPEPLYHDDFARLRVELAKAKADLATAVDALNWIASWREGEEVRGSFDEPWSARTARQALIRLRVPRP